MSDLEFVYGGGYPNWQFRHIGGISKKRADLIHFWNSISWGTTPWITTFESLMPRTSEAHSLLCDDPKPLKIPVGVKQMASSHCKALIAISQNAYDRQMKFLALFPKYSEIIAKKITVLHPPQAIIFNDVSRFDHIDTVRFFFVGASFWRKGGEESFNVLKKLHDEGFKVDLTIVSSLLFQDYAVRKLTESDKSEIIEKFEQEKSWCHYFPRISNSEVLTLMKNSHVVLLPTHADTYGYSVLEGQACGCPVISTNIRALPEINNEECGYLIKIPKNKWGEAYFSSDEQIEKLSHDIESGLEICVREIMANPSQLKAKALKSLIRIEKFHDPQQHANELKKIYVASGVCNT